MARYGKAMVYVCGNRKLLFLVFVAKPSHISYDLKGVGIHGVIVKQVELHLSYDPLELR